MNSPQTDQTLKAQSTKEIGVNGQRTIRLALVANRFEIGGLERCMATLVNNLPRKSIEPIIISFGGDCKAAGWIERKSIEVVNLENGIPNDPRLTFRLIGALRRLKVDIAHSHNWGSLIETGIATKVLRIPHVHAEHGLEFSQRQHGFRGKLKPMLKRAFFRRASSVVAIAECVQKRLGEVYRIEQNKVVLIPNGVPVPNVGNRSSNYAEIRQNLSIQPDARICGLVGRAAYVKGFDNAIQAFASVAKQSNRFHMVIVGDGNELNKLKSLRDELELSDQIHFAGYQKNVGYWLSGFDVFLNSSRSEAMNLGIIEAMATGLPIIATDVGDNAVMVKKHQNCGAIVQPDEIASMSNAILELLGDATRSDHLGANSKSVYDQRYTVDVMTNNYLSLYQKLVKPIA